MAPMNLRNCLDQTVGEVYDFSGFFFATGAAEGACAAAGKAAAGFFFASATASVGVSTVFPSFRSTAAAFVSNTSPSVGTSAPSI
jgi:hypothetical protein